MWKHLLISSLFIALPASATDVDYKSKTLGQLLGLCEQGDSFACFTAAHHQKKAGDHRARIESLERGASVQGPWNNQSAVCMYRLAQAYSEGDGVPQDFEQAYKWANILGALPKGSPFQIVGQGIRDKLLPSMTPEQIAAGQRASKQWLAGHPKW
jgi:hypothetical protein